MDQTKNKNNNIEVFMFELQIKCTAAFLFNELHLMYLFSFSSQKIYFTIVSSIMELL